MDRLWAHHCQADSHQSKFLFNRNRKFYFWHKHLKMRIVELYYKKAKGEYLNPGCLPAPPGDKLKSEPVEKPYPALWSTTWEAVRLDTQMYLQLKLWASSFCQATAANVHIHDTISFCLKQLHFHLCMRARAVQTRMLRTPLGHWSHPKRAVLSKLSTGKMLKQFLPSQCGSLELLKKEVKCPMRVWRTSKIFNWCLFIAPGEGRRS